MAKRSVYKSALFTEDESKAIAKRLYELSIERRVTVSDYIRDLVLSDLNGNAPPPDIIDDCVKEKIAEMEAEDDKQDDEQVAINDSKQDDEQEATDYWEGITT